MSLRCSQTLDDSMKTQQKIAADTTLAKVLAPEDVRVGDYVAVLDEIYEFPAIAWLSDPPLSNQDEVIQVRLRPREATSPLCVVDACLPYVFVKSPRGKPKTLDLRSCRLARLDRHYAKRVWKELNTKPKKKK